MLKNIPHPVPYSDKIFQEGYEAYWNANDSFDNPYDDSSDESYQNSLDWKNGYETAYKDDELSIMNRELFLEYNEVDDWCYEQDED